MEEILSQLNFEKGNGLLPTIVQDADGKVLMLAYSSKESLQKTIELGKATYFSRSRKELWTKGLTSGNVQNIREIRIDCDGDTILFVVEQVGGSSCHTGYDTCFYRKLEDGKLIVIGKKVFDPEEVYNEA